MKKNLNVFITDGRSRATLVIAEFLKKSFGDKLNIIVGEDRLFCHSFFSKYSDKKHRYPKFKSGPEHLKYILKLIVTSKIDIFIPVRDDYTHFFSKYKKILSRYTNFIVPDLNVLDLANNKKRIAFAASKIGIDVSKIVDSSNFDKIINKSKIISRPVKGTGSRGISIIESKSQKHHLNFNDSNYILQEYVKHQTSDQYAVASLFDNNSKPLANFVLRKLREYPSSGGPMTYAVSVKNKDLIEKTNSLLSSIGWKGMCCTEYIFDSRTSTFKLTEINTRFYGAIGTALHSGINFPHIIVDSLKGKNVTYNCDYKVDSKWRWLFFGDILSAIDLRHSKRAKYSDFFSFRDVNFAIFSFSDLGATVGNILDVIYRLLNSGERKFALDRGSR